MKQYPIYVNGQMELTSEAIPVLNPATGESIGRMSTTDRARLAGAIDAAHHAWSGWRRLTGRDRGQFLNRIADRIEERREEIARSEEIARTITLENGKPLAQSAGEVAMSIDHLRWFAEEARRAYGRIIPHQADGKRNLVVKAPLGVIGAISPWNFPLALAVRKIAPALAAGNTVVLKPAGQTPLSAVAFAECVAAADLPPAVFQMLVGPPDEFGR
ncbi:MAG: aldehyde dehydrogenase family protein, partial [Acidobacteria bacterium]|nr:aldehyde dehydrogenase family protein [Acidobacteriota bacterium]